MIHLKLIDGEYKIGNSILPTKILLEYPHEINGDVGHIITPLAVGISVTVYPTTSCRLHFIDGKKKIISEFTVFGGSICARFEGSNVPHWIDCIEPN